MSTIKGYKGVMDLDLSLVPKEYIKVAIDQHYKDIIEYKKYQSALKPQHRYENTVERIKKNIEDWEARRAERVFFLFGWFGFRKSLSEIRRPTHQKNRINMAYCPGLHASGKQAAEHRLFCRVLICC